jgi:hypothetical protein|tara:strand:+ start:152 stop:514 length:363 start_codon:yes stop_codon:yes gene_type:complete
MLNKLKNMFQSPKKEKTTTKETDKEIATRKGEPYIKVIDTNVDPKNPKYGYFELDWNKHFVKNLKDNGFSGNSDEEIVDHWFSVLCNTIAEEGQSMMPSNTTNDSLVSQNRRDDGKTEIS